MIIIIINFTLKVYLISLSPLRLALPVSGVTNEARPHISHRRLFYSRVGLMVVNMRIQTAELATLYSMGIRQGYLGTR